MAEERVPSLILEVPGLPPFGADDRGTASLISEARSVMRKSKFPRISNKGVKLEIEFQARVASGISDPIAIIGSITNALEKAGALSKPSIRELTFIRRTGEETKYRIRISRL